MTVKSSSFWDQCRDGAATGFFRALIGTPLDAFTTESIVSNKKTQETISTIWEKGYLYRGFWAYAGRQMLRTPVTLVSTHVGSGIYKSSAPESAPPALRGIVVGMFVGGVETVVVVNPFRSIQTQLLTGLSWKAIRAQGAAGLRRGLDAALVHRVASWALFMGTYEALHEKSTFVASTVAGTVQVAASSPVFVAMIRKQKAGQPNISLRQMISKIYKENGIMGLFRPGLEFRLVHSWCVSYIAMAVMEKLGVMRR